MSIESAIPGVVQMANERLGAKFGNASVALPVCACTQCQGAAAAFQRDLARRVSLAGIVTSEPPRPSANNPTGWECPRCHTVWNPAAMKCDCAAARMAQSTQA